MKDEGRTKGVGRGLPRISAEKCTGCGACAKVCFHKAVSFDENDKALIFQRRCTGIENCGRCLNVCDNEAITVGGN